MQERDIMRRYLDDISQYPLLTLEQERSYALKASEGDEAAYERLVQSNLRLVIYIARGYLKKNNGFQAPVDLLDLVQEGNLGLIKAARNFDLSHKVKFVTYAALWIKAHIREALYHKSRMVLLPVRLAEEFKHTVYGELLPIEDMNEIMESTVHYTDEFLRKHTKIAIRELLSPEELELIEMRYWKDMTFQEIGDAKDRTRQRIEQKEKKIMRRLKRSKKLKQINQEGGV